MRSVLRLSSMPVIVLLYCAAFNYAYVQWISPTWVSLGFADNDPNRELMIVGYVLAAMQCIIPPFKIERPSQTMYWMLYFFAYVPGLFVPLYLQLVNDTDLLLLQLSMSAGMLLIALSYRIPLPTFRRWPLTPRTFWTIFGVLFLLCNAFLLITFRGKLQFASIEEMYSVRSLAADVVQDNRAVGYISRFLFNIINPFLIVYGLYAHRKKMIVLGILGQIVIYLTAAEKSAIAAPLLILFFYFTIKRDRINWAIKMGLCFVVMLFALTVLPLGDMWRFVLDVVLMRSFAMPGMLIGQYQYFFQVNPHTHWGHIHGINLFVSNPYKSIIPIEISRFFGVPTMYGDIVANTCFFALDGISGFGLPGIPLMGILCAAVFLVLDGCTKKIPMEFSVAGLTMYIMGLPNGSLFSTLLGQDLFIWMLLYMSIPTRFFRNGSKV